MSVPHLASSAPALRLFGTKLREAERADSLSKGGQMDSSKRCGKLKSRASFGGRGSRRNKKMTHKMSRRYNKQGALDAEEDKNEYFENPEESHNDTPSTP